MMIEMLRLAAEAAKSRRAKRTFLIGAVAVRNRDSVIVKSSNGSNTMPCGHIHAEARVLRKAGLESTIYVARILRKDGRLSMARPCANCLGLMKSYRVKRCVYTISETEYGVISFDNKLTERIKSFSV